MIKRLQRREMSIILFLFIYCYSIFMQFVRGSGLDLLFLYLLLSLPFILLLNLVKKITNETKKKYTGQDWKFNSWL